MLEAGYWLFSTLVQAMAALFAVVGVFIIFKIQLLKERMTELVKAAKDEYLSKKWKALQADKWDEEQRNVSTYTLKELTAAFKKLIKYKKERLSNNKKAFEKAKKDNNNVGINIYGENVKKLENDIFMIKASLNPLKEINNNLKDIKIKGRNSLIGIGVLFVWSLSLLFLAQFIGGMLISILGLLTVVFTIFIIIYLTRIIIESLK